MKLLSLALFLSAVTANPIVPRQPQSQDQGLQPFHLKTTSASNPDHNNLYVYAYHTGAGLNDAVLTKDINTASKAVLNQTNTQFQLSEELKWGMVMPGDTNYAAWEPVRINAGASTDGFTIKDGMLRWDEKPFAGWLVCDWYHNAPQLFYLYRYMKAEIPGSCSEVQLKTEDA